MARYEIPESNKQLLFFDSLDGLLDREDEIMSFSISNDHNMASSDILLEVDCSSNEVNIVLLNPTILKKDKTVWIVDTKGNASVNNITTSGFNVSGNSSITLSINYESALLWNNGIEWIRLV